ncbi:aromatic-L-amino-acid/L-tryptophan decarboxylase [Gammaproteobacteria bacterium]
MLLTQKKLVELARSLEDRTDLDPSDWSAFREDAHRILNDMLDYVEGIRHRPVWSKMPNEIRKAFHAPLPGSGRELSTIHTEFMDTVLPYTVGNVHPRFMGWVHGGGTAVGMVGEMVAAGLNANLGGRDHAPIEVERQVVRWIADLFHFPATATGLLVTGTSIANFIAVLIARVATLGAEVRRTGIGSHALVAYASTAIHNCVPKALDMAGFGTDALRLIQVDESGRIDLIALADTVTRDRNLGYRPFLVVGSAGTVNTGAIDDLLELSRFCRREGLWFHIDGAIGALGMLSPTLRPRFSGLEQADSIAFDFHKWGQIPYDAGCLLVRDGATQECAFATDAAAAYLRRESRGLAGGEAPWPCDLGPDLSRGFRALKVWYSFQALGADRLGAAIERTCTLAQYLSLRIELETDLEHMTPTTLNIVCFRYRFSCDGNRQNAELAADIQESGRAVLSTTKIGGNTVLRCAIVNHRSRVEDMDILVDTVLVLGRQRAAETGSA